MHIRYSTSLPLQSRRSNSCHVDRLSTIADDEEDIEGVELIVAQMQRPAWFQHRPDQQQVQRQIERPPSPSPTPAVSPPGPPRATTISTTTTTAAVTPTQLNNVDLEGVQYSSKAKTKSRLSRKLRLPMNHHRRANSEQDTETKTYVQANQSKMKSNEVKSPVSIEQRASAKTLTPKTSTPKKSTPKKSTPKASTPKTSSPKTRSPKATPRKRVDRRRSDEPIDTPHDHDVLSGRGVNIYRHSGNKRFQNFVSKWKEEYIMKTSIKDKPKIVEKVMDMIEALDPPGRFLELKEHQNLNSSWVEMDRKKAAAKVSQALREGATSIRLAEKKKGNLPVDEGQNSNNGSWTQPHDAKDDRQYQDTSEQSDAGESVSAASSVTPSPEEEEEEGEEEGEEDYDEQNQSSEEGTDNDDDDDDDIDEVRSNTDDLADRKSKISPEGVSPEIKKTALKTPVKGKPAVTLSTSSSSTMKSPNSPRKSRIADKFCPKQRQWIIYDPRETDVISGRGAAIYQHSGNKLLRDIVKDRKEIYILQASRTEKVQMVEEVMSLIRGLDPPGRFLEPRRPSQDEKGKLTWIEMEESKALSKISQLLREGATEVRRTTGALGSGSVDASEHDSDDAILPTKKQAIMRMAVEKLCTKTGRVLQVFKDAEMARRSVTDTTNKQPFIKALRGKGKLGREYHGYFWRVQGSKEKPRIVPSKSESSPPDAITMKLIPKSMVSPGQKRRAGVENHSSDYLDRSPKRHRTDHVSVPSASESEKGGEKYEAHSGNSPKRHSDDHESEGDESSDSASPDDTANTTPKRKIDTMRADDEATIGLGDMEDSEILELPVEKLCTQTGRVLNTFKTARHARKSVTNSHREKKFIKVLKGTRENGSYYKGFFWRVRGSSHVPDTATKHGDEFADASDSD